MTPRIHTDPIWCNADSPSPQADVKSSIVLKNLKGKRTHIFTFGKSRMPEWILNFMKPRSGEPRRESRFRSLQNFLSRLSFAIVQKFLENCRRALRLMRDEFNDTDCINKYNWIYTLAVNAYSRISAPSDVNHRKFWLIYLSQVVT